MTETPTDALAERIEHWISEHPSRAFVERFPVEDVRALLAERKQLLRRVERAEEETTMWRNAAHAEVDGGKARADAYNRVVAAMDEIEKRAREAEQAGTASAYCALWDAHGLVQDALARPAAPIPQPDGSAA